MAARKLGGGGGEASLRPQISRDNFSVALFLIRVTLDGKSIRRTTRSLH